jgi:hypothetical protein
MKRTALPLALLAALALAQAASPGLVSDGSQMFQQSSPGFDGEPESRTGQVGLGVPGDMFGSALAAGDFNRDGFRDLAIGVPGEDASFFIENTGFVGHGGVHIVYGTAYGHSGHDSVFIQPAALGLVNTWRDGFGATLAAGDFNADGITDLAVGAPNRNRRLNNGEDLTYGGTGEVFILFGSEEGLRVTGFQTHFAVNPWEDADDHYGDRFGSVLEAADFDGNGSDDLVIGAPGFNPGGPDRPEVGKVVVIYESAAGVLRRDEWAQDSPGMEGLSETFDRFGTALATGDIDANGSPDLVVGVPGEDDGAGAVAVLYSEPGTGLHPLAQGRNQLITQDSVIDDHGVMAGSELGDEFGSSVAVGDFNGDGGADVAVGVPNESEDGIARTGAIAVLYGQRFHPDVPGSGKVTAVGNQFFGGDPSTSMGLALTTGDFNGDGLADLVVTLSSQQVRVYYGRFADYFSGEVLGQRIEVWSQDSAGIDGGAEPADQFGAELLAADLNANGADDLIVGVPGEDGDAGAINVIYGEPLDNTPPVITHVVTGVNASGWATGNATVTFTATDAQTGIRTLSGCDPQLIQSDGIHTFTCMAISLGGTSSATVTVSRDATPPLVTWTAAAPAANAAGWHTVSPSYGYTVSDNLSGVSVGSGTTPILGEGTNLRGQVLVVDGAGNEAEYLSPGVNVDRTPPALTFLRSALPNANGWNRTFVNVTPVCDDALSGVASCPAEEYLTTEDVHNVTRTITDRAGNSTTASSGPIRIDVTPPHVLTQFFGTVSISGWYPSALVRFTGSDLASAIAGATVREHVFPEGAAQTRSETFTDLAGNQATGSYGPINVDGTAPAIVFGAPEASFAGGTGQNGWFTGPAHVPFSTSDGGSGIGSITIDGGMALASRVEFSFQSPDPQTRVVAVKDLAGNTVQVTSPPIRIDTSAPVVAFNFSAGAGPFTRGQAVVLSFSCTDPQSGVGTCAGDVPSGSAIDTSSPGLHSIELRSTNVAGLETTVTATYAIEAEQCTAPPANIESWWTGDVEAGDLMGVRHLAAVGTVGIGDGQVLSGFAFTNQGYLTPAAGQPDLRLLSSGQPLSLSLWIKPEQAGGMIATRANDFAFAVDNQGFLWRRLGNDGWVKTTTVLPAGQWSHLAVTLAPSGAGVMYVNGLSANTFAVPAPVADGPGDRRFRLGSIPASYYQIGGTPPPGIVLWPPTVTGFMGEIDEVMVVRRSLTAAEVSAAYTAGAAGFCKVLPAALEVAPVAGSFGGEVTLSAKRFDGFTPVAGRTIEFLVDGTVVGSAVTDDNGDALLTIVLTGVSAGDHLITARDAAAGFDSAPAPAAISRATPALSWTAPEAIVAGTPLGATQLSAVASVTGTFAFTPSAGALLSEGTHVLSAIFTPADTQNYTGGQVTTSIVVTAAPPPPPPPPDEEEDVTTPGSMRGDGFVDGPSGRHHFEFAVQERAPKGERGQLTLKVDADTKRKRPRPDKFISTGVSAIAFSDDNAFRPARKPRKAPAVDSVVFSGTGEWNGVAGYTFEAVATDQGEPGRGKDTITVTIRGAAGVVATVTGTLDGGNIQSLRLPGRHR